MVNPFQMQLIVSEFNSPSLESQSIGCFTSFQLFLSHTSCARSRSNPTYSPLSSLNPYGGNEASNPTTNSSSFVFASFVDFPLSDEPESLLPHPANTVVAAIAVTRSSTNLFFITYILLYSFYVCQTAATLFYQFSS